MSSLVQIRSESALGFELLPSTPQDRYHDYCLEPYRPRRPPGGKLRSENLLWHSLSVAGCIDAFKPALEAVQRDVGRDMTVWGVKHRGGGERPSELWWELYFYDPDGGIRGSEDPRPRDPPFSLSSVARTLSPWVTIVPAVRETIPYMMASFDLRAESFAAKEIPEVNLYLTGQKEHAGRSFSVGREGFELRNTYRFMGPKADIDVLLPLLKSSVYVDYGNPTTLSKVLIPELFACKRVCVAKKRHCDAIYFSGLAIAQLLWFLKRFDYPQPLVDFATAHRESLEHIYFDVGIDVVQDADGTVRYPKTSYYATL